MEAAQVVADGSQSQTTCPSWSPRDYLEKYRVVPKYDDSMDLIQQQCIFLLDAYHKFYANYRRSLDPGSARLLEYGGGPSIAALISGCVHVKEIVFSDYMLENCQEVEKWVVNDPDAFNWTPFFKHVVCQLEENPGEEAVKKRKQMLRSKITAFASANIRNSQPLESDFGEFDIVSCNFVLGVANDNKQQFEESVKKLSGLIKPNGYLLLMESIEEHWYSVNDIKCPHLSLKPDEILHSLEKAGFKVLGSQNWNIPEYRPHYTNDAKSKMFFIAQK